MKKLLLLLTLAVMFSCSSTKKPLIVGNSIDLSDIKTETTSTYKNPQVVLRTSLGDITVELYEDKVPNTVANIITLTESGFYRDLRFHRVISGFMAQGGCPHSKRGARTGRPGTGNPGYRFADEFHSSLRHTGRGVLSMANSGRNTHT